MQHLDMRWNNCSSNDLCKHNSVVLDSDLSYLIDVHLSTISTRYNRKMIAADVPAAYRCAPDTFLTACIHIALGWTMMAFSSPFVRCIERWDSQLNRIRFSLQSYWNWCELRNHRLWQEDWHKAFWFALHALGRWSIGSNDRQWNIESNWWNISRYRSNDQCSILQKERETVLAFFTPIMAMLWTLEKVMQRRVQESIHFLSWKILLRGSSSPLFRYIWYDRARCSRLDV